MNWNKESFAAFILTHNRADHVDTVSSLRKGGYTGPIHFVIDNQDESYEAYVENFGRDNVHVFDKIEWAKKTDKACNFGDYRSVVYARNASFDIAKKLGYKYFLMLDDDYTVFQHVFRPNKTYHATTSHQLDAVFFAFLSFLKKINARTVALAQGGDFIGGGESNRASSITLWRKAMNCFFCKTDNPIPFVGTVNEDVNAYVNDARTGAVYLTHNAFRVVQRMTQTNSGGLTDIYKSQGTYFKSFYSVIFAPSCVKVSAMGWKEYRLHHRISWVHAVPKIVHERHKKNVS
jgi:hypothetical protein